MADSLCRYVTTCPFMLIRNPSSKQKTMAASRSLLTAKTIKTVFVVCITLDRDFVKNKEGPSNTKCSKVSCGSSLFFGIIMKEPVTYKKTGEKQNKKALILKNWPGEWVARGLSY